MSEAAVRERLSLAGVVPVGNSPAEFSKFVESESRRWQALVKARCIRLD